MKVWGLTGGAGMGKTTTARLLGELGAKVIDTDDLARELVEPGQPSLEEIRAVFGEGVVDSEGRLRREALAGLVFADTAARVKLEEILHPRIRKAWREQVEVWRAGGESLTVVVIPLLFETRAESLFDKIICVACLPPSQTERLRARGWTPAHIAQRLAAQWPIETKMSRADYVIWAEGDLDSTGRQVERVVGRRALIR